MEIFIGKKLKLCRDQLKLSRAAFIHWVMQNGGPTLTEGRLVNIELNKGISVLNCNELRGICQIIGINMDYFYDDKVVNFKPLKKEK